MATPIPTLEQIEESAEFLGMSPERQVRVYGQWKRDVTERLKDPDDQAFIENVVNGRAQQRLESRGVVGESAQLFKEKFLGNIHNFTRGINGTIAQAARLASSELSAQSPGTNEAETRIAQTNQNIILQLDRQMDGLREEFVKLGQDPKANRDRRVEIAKSMRALEETKRKSEETLKPIIEKTKAEGFLAEVAGNQELAAQRAKNSLGALRNRFKQSEKFQDRPIVTGVVAGLAELGPMIAQAVTGPGMVTMAMDLGQRAEDQARAAVPDMTDEEAFAVRVLGGSVSMALEKIGIETAIGRIFQGTPGLSGSHIATRVAKGAIAEGLTEAAQGVAVGEIIQAVTMEEQDTIFTPEAFKERLTEAIVGGILGGGLGAIGGKRRQPEEPLPEDSPPMADPEGPQTAPPLTPSEAANPAGTPPLTTEDTEGPLGMAQSTDGKKNALVQFQSDRDKGLFDAYKRFVEGETTPEDLALIKDATDSGIDVSAFGKDIQAQIDGAEADSIISAPPPPVLSPELREASRIAEEETTSAPTSEEANVPRGTNEQPPLEPREVFRQVRKAIEGVPNVSAKIMEMPFGSGVTWTPSGNLQFTVTPSALQGKGDDPRFIMDEEVTHLAEVLGARDEWEAGGKEGTFQEFLDKRAREHAAGIDKELLDLRSADRKIAARALVESIRAYSRAGTDQNIDFAKLEQIAETGSVADVLAAARASGVGGSDASIYSEWLRQTDQLARTGTTTESAGETDAGVFARMTNLVDAIREAIRKSLEWIDRGRSVLRKSPTFTGDIDAITRKRQELSLPALSRPQTTQQTPPAAEVPRTPPEVVEQQGTEGMPAEEAARVHRVSDPPPTPPLRPTPPGEGEGFVTGPQNKNVDLEREALGLKPRDPIMRTTFGEMWDRAKEINFDGQAGSELVNELLENPRALNPEEVAILGHEQVRRRHELDKAMERTNDGSSSERQRGLSFEKFREAQVAMNRIADAIQNMGTLQGQALNLRKMLIDDQFDLVTLQRSEQAGVNGGDPLSAKQKEEINGFFTRIKSLRNALAAATTPKSREQIEFELAKEITKHIARRNARIFKRLDAGKKALAASTEVMNLARAMMTTFDFSATLRQGGLVSVSHPILASRAFKSQMEAFASERGEFEVMQGIRNDPLHAVMVADGNILHVGETTLAVELDRKQKGRDEAYQSVISGKIPVVKGFGRAYQTFMNKLRFDYYKQLVDSLSAGTAEQRNALAKWVNITTGRGGPENLGEVAGFMGAVFFAPRYIASRFQYLATPITIWSQPKGVKRIIAKEFAKQIGGIGTVMSMFLLAKEAFDEEDEWGIEFDRRSSDYLKLRIGNTRVDMLSGLQQIMVLQKRVATGQTKRITDEEADRDSWLTGSTFLRTKFSPVVGVSWDVLSGKNVIGQPAGLLDMQDIPIITNMTGAQAPGPFVNLFVPLVFSEIVDAIEEQGAVKGTALSLATILGWAASTYSPDEPFGKTEGGSGKLIREYGYGGLIKELYTRSTEQGKLLLKAFSEDKPAVLTR